MLPLPSFLDLMEQNIMRSIPKKKNAHTQKNKQNCDKKQQQMIENFEQCALCVRMCSKKDIKIYIR